MNLPDAVRTCFVKYVDFQGRASRSEFWWWMLFCTVGMVLTGGMGTGPYVAFIVLTLLPGVSVTTRRLHDIDRGGWAQLIFLVPLLGAIVFIAWMVRRGTAGPNRYGPATA
jgi:uncharacterized membrane protein YhaH (DUF805 family)